ncbi:hypothetical protein [Stenotrophomonas cyclobalanopsidis]
MINNNVVAVGSRGLNMTKILFRPIIATIRPCQVKETSATAR